MNILNLIINLPRNIGKLLIRIYQFFLSFDHSFWSKWINYRICIHDPSCSEFTYQAINRFGLIKGSIMGFFRIMRCNPFSEGGYDPVPDKFRITKAKLQ